MRSIRLKTTLSLAALLALAGTALAQPKEGKGEEEEAAAEGEAGEEAAEEGEEKAGEAAEAAPPEDEPPAVDALRQQYLALRDQLFLSRARAAAVASSLYSTRLTLYLHHESGRHWTITRSTIRLDGANVFDDSEGSIAADKAPRFSGFVAPGRHLVSVRVEATATDDERFATVLDNQFVIQAPRGKDVSVIMKASDEGNLPYQWKKKAKGTYALRLGALVETSERKTEGGKPKIRGR